MRLAFIFLGVFAAGMAGITLAHGNYQVTALFGVIAVICAFLSGKRQ